MPGIERIGNPMVSALLKGPSQYRGNPVQQNLQANQLGQGNGAQGASFKGGLQQALHQTQQPTLGSLTGSTRGIDHSIFNQGGGSSGTAFKGGSQTNPNQAQRTLGLPTGALQEPVHVKGTNGRTGVAGGKFNQLF